MPGKMQKRLKLLEAQQPFKSALLLHFNHFQSPLDVFSILYV